MIRKRAWVVLCGRKALTVTKTDYRRKIATGERGACESFAERINTQRKIPCGNPLEGWESDWGDIFHRAHNYY